MNSFDLGSHRRTVSTSSSKAQEWFNLGLNWCFGFNQEEAVACFYQALEFDPDCVMAHWGVAYASGPFYNFPWRDFSPEQAVACTALCHRHIESAKANSASATPVENALVEALAARFQLPHPVTFETYDQWDDAYAEQMREVQQRFSHDLDVSALLIEALMTRTPWRLWDVKSGEPLRGSDTIEALELCESALTQAAAPHPALLHLHIHLLEMSTQPERAMASADALATLCPDAGHLNHMPCHIYALCGRYRDAKDASARAIAADDMYAAYAGPFNFYTSARCHDLHMMMYVCMMLGQFKPALAAADQICETLTPEVLSLKDQPKLMTTLEGYYSMRMHVLVRFGRWQTIVDDPMPPNRDLYCVSTAMSHYAKGVANAALKNFDAAEEQRQHFSQALTRIPSGRRFFNNFARDVLAVGQEMLDGEMAYHRAVQGQDKEASFDDAFTHLREAVILDDDLYYTEPWAWMHPPRHALGALLMEQDRLGEAEAVYRADLGRDQPGLGRAIQRCAQHPDNIWALVGLAECLESRSPDSAEYSSINASLAKAQDLADADITTSCMCRGAGGPS